MLTTTPASRRRLAAGAATIALVIAAGLGLTASGTAAVAAVTTRVGDSIGVDLTQAVPPPPEPPAANPALPAAPVPPAPIAGTASNSVSVTSTDGKVTRVRTVRARNGETVSTEIAGMPEISERDCKTGPDGNAQQFVLNRQIGTKKVMIICSNRIEQAAAAGVEQGMAAAGNVEGIKRNALATAIASLEQTRAGIAANRDMPAEDRTEALAEIDAAMVEVRQEINAKN